MARMSCKILGSLILISVGLVGPNVAHGQIRRVGPGSTVEGDTLRGQGVFLQGRGWYELNSAKARAFDLNTEKAIAEWNQQVYDAYLRDRNASMTQKKYATEKLRAEAERKRIEREARLRTNPTTDEIQNGDALNALLVDLSNPSIGSSMRNHRVELPSDLSVKSLIFRFAPKSGARGSQQLSKGVIALAMLDREKGWPGILNDEALAKERKNYEEAYRKVKDNCLKGQTDLAAVLAMDKSIEALRDKANAVIPTDRNYRSKANQILKDMKAATVMFDADTMDFAREMIVDTQSHDAHSVEELLEFMRKYRLLFTSAMNNPGAGETYGRLYGLLRQQKEALGLSGDAKQVGATAPMSAASLTSIKDQLNLARGEVSKLNFGGNPTRAPQKVRAIKLLGEAILATGKGQLTKEPLETALTELNSLQTDGKKMSEENRELIKSAVERISLIVKGLK